MTYKVIPEECKKVEYKKINLLSREQKDPTLELFGGTKNKYHMNKSDYLKIKIK